MLRNYPKNQTLASVGKKIFEREYENDSDSNPYPIDEIEFCKNQELGAGSNQYQNLRLRFISRVRLPTVKELRAHENAICCPMIEFENGEAE